MMTRAVTTNLLPMEGRARAMTPKSRRMYVPFLIAATTTILSGCGESQTTTPAAKVEPPPLEVKTAQPRRGEITRYITLPGEVHPLFKVTLFAKVSGYLKDLKVDKGDAVKTGDLVAQIEVPELQADKAIYEYELQVAELAAQELAIKVAVDGDKSLQVAKAKVALAKANLDKVEKMLAYARVTAPFDGVVTKRFV